jgi:nucleoid-associated protein YgaU
MIAKKYYGDPIKYKKIFEANIDKLKNPDIIYPGQNLIIPNK